MKKLPLILITITAIAVGGWYYYTTTPDYLVASIKQACAKDVFAEMANTGIAHINGETRELTEDERAKMNEVFERMTNKEECPFKDKVLTKEKLSQADLDRYKVKDGYKLTFEDSEASDLKILKFNGRWRYLLIEADFAIDSPAIMESPQIEVTAPQTQASPSYEAPAVEYNSVNTPY